MITTNFVKIFECCLYKIYFKKDHIKIAPKKYKNAPTVFPPKKYENPPKNIFVFFRGKTVVFFRGIFVFFMGDFNIIPLKISLLNNYNEKLNQIPITFPKF